MASRISRREWVRGLPSASGVGKYDRKRAHSASERSVGYGFLIEDSVRNHPNPHPYQTGSKMHLGELLYRIVERGVSLRCGWSEYRLHYHPKDAIEPELLDELRRHKMDVIRIMREDEEMRRTGIIQSERQVFDLAREYFGDQDEAGAA